MPWAGVPAAELLTVMRLVALLLSLMTLCVWAYVYHVVHILCSYILNDFCVCVLYVLFVCATSGAASASGRLANASSAALVRVSVPPTQNMFEQCSSGAECNF